MTQQTGRLSDRLPPDPPPRSAPPGPISYEEFLDWCDEDTYAEWVDGDIIMVSPASDEHQRIVQFLVWLFQAVIERTDAGVVRSAPYQMRLPEPLRRGREPDVMFIAREHRGRIRPNYLDGPADLVVEVVSPESASRDRDEKFLEYQAAGIPEYWLIDPTRQWADLYRLDTNGRYAPGFSGQDGVYDSRALAGLRLRVSWLWQDPPPKQIEVRRELGLP